MAKPYTHENDKMIADLYLAGETGYSIAKRLGVTDPTVYRALGRQGIDRRPGGRFSAWEDTEDNRRDMVAAYEAGDSIRTIAKRLGTHSRLVTQVLNESELEWRHPGGRRRFSDEQAAEFARAYLSGEGLVQVGKQYGTSAKIIRDYLVRAGVELRPFGAPAFWTEERKAEAVQRYEDGEQLKDIAAAMGCGRDTLARTLAELGAREIPPPKVRGGPGHPSWRGGRRIDGSGYVIVKVPDGDQHLADKTRAGYMMEHRLVMARMLGRRLRPGETVHHINGNRQDNRPGNLQLRRGKHGKGSVFRCASCGSHDIEAVPLGDALCHLTWRNSAASDTYRRAAR